MADIKTVTLTGSEVRVDVERRHCHIRNLGNEMIYASIKSDIVPDADGVLGIPAGARDVLTNTDGHVYIKGTGKVQIVGSEYADGILGGLAGGDINAAVAAAVAKIVADAPADFDTLKEISDWIYSHADSAAEMNSEIQALKTDVADGVPANGGNADTLDNLHANQIASNPNLLINPDFKINQRGQTTYIGGGSRYSVDRWWVSAAGSLTVNSDSITISASDTADYTWFEHYVYNMSTAVGKQLTGTVTLKDGTIVSVCGLCPLEKSETRARFAQVPIGDTPNYLRLFRAADSDDFDILFQVQLPKGERIELSSAKLELGSIATPFVPPDHAIELLKCGSIEETPQILISDGIWSNVPSNPNLLINPDFRINQRGQTEYTFNPSGPLTKIYGLDRWFTRSKATKIILMENGVKITYSGNSTTSAATMEQAIKNFSEFVGQNLTYSVNFQEINAKGANMTAIAWLDDGTYRSLGEQPVTQQGVNTMTLNPIPENATDFWIGIYGADPRKGDTTDSYSIVDWAKLEPGSIVTPFIPPDPATELLKCGSIEEAPQILYSNGQWGNIPSNPNLIINPDFRINQRGQTVYNSVGYTVDHWRLWKQPTVDTLGTLTVNDDGSITLASGGTRLDTYLMQWLENGKSLVGKQVTASLNITSITGAWVMAQHSNFSFAMTISSTGIASFSFIWGDTDHRLLLYNDTSDATITIDAMKLELGSIATPFVPPDPAIELTKCQRYYQFIRRYNPVRAAGVDTNFINFSIPLATSMRSTIPSLTSQNLQVCTVNNVVQTGFDYSTTTSSSGNIIIKATKAAHGLTDAILRVENSEYIGLDAEFEGV